MSGLIRDRYEPLEVVGTGGQGEVLRALDRQHGRTVAIKVRATAGDADRSRLLAEARILLDLRPHPGLPLVREDFFEGGRYYLVMDWVAGRTLREMLDEHGAPGLPFEEVLPVLEQVAAALDHLHEHQPPVCHRDVKPENVVVTADGRAVLVDFGIATPAGRTPDGVPGTRGYTAPERLAGARDAPSADIYALAATAFTALTGEHPGAGARPRWRGVPREHAAVIDAAMGRALAFDPSRRFASAGAFVAALRSPAASPHNLPLQLTSFVGREREIAEVSALVAAERLVTLTGAGGVGKTRLALEVAAGALLSFPDGVWVVEMGGLRDAASVPLALAAAIGEREDGERGPAARIEDRLVDALLARQVLLVLDDCEHLAAACASLAATLLRACANVRILVTSRVPLDVGGEVVKRVAPLAVPAPGAAPATLVEFESVRLFVDRARRTRRAFAIDEANAEAVAAICLRLDGIPLAIELAAARAASLSPQQIAERLDDRFRLLTQGERTALPHRRTLQAAIDWSFDLLSEKERVLARRLSVFAGGLTLEAAEAVSAGEGLESHDVLDLLSALVGKSLVIAEDRPESRFSMLETIRAYAAARLEEAGETTAARDAHLAWFAALAHRAEGELGRAEQAVWLDRLDDEHDNMRDALAWALERGADALGLATALARFWEIRGHLSEGRAALEGAIAAALSPDASTLATALQRAALLAQLQGDYAAAAERLERGLALRRDASDERGIASVLADLAMIAQERGDHATAERQYEESLQIRRRLGDRKGIATSLNNLGTLASSRGHHDAARARYEESLALHRELGDRRGIAQGLGNLAGVAHELGDYRTAEAQFSETLAIMRELGDARGVATTLACLGLLDDGLGRYDQARAHFKQAIDIAREIGSPSRVAAYLGDLGYVMWEQMEDGAADVLGESIDLARSLGNKRQLSVALGHLALVEAARGRIEEAGKHASEGLAIARELGDERVTADALENLGKLALARGDLAQAASMQRESLRLRAANRQPWGIASSLRALGESCVVAGDHARAALLLGAAEAMAESLGSPLAPPERPAYERAVASLKASLDPGEFARLWSSGRSMSADDAFGEGMAAFA